MDTDPISLKRACSLYPEADLTEDALKAEAKRGRLTIFKIGRRLYVTAAGMREMVRKCQDDARPPGSTSIESEASGLSETDRASSALAALNQTVVELKAGLPRISGKNTNRRVGQTH